MLTRRLSPKRAGSEYRHGECACERQETGVAGDKRIRLSGQRKVQEGAVEESLVDVVVRRLDREQDRRDRALLPDRHDGVAEGFTLPVAPPPTLANQPPPAGLQKMLPTARKFDAAERDETSPWDAPARNGFSSMNGRRS